VFTKIMKTAPVLLSVLLVASCNSTDSANTLDLSNSGAQTTPAVIQGKCPKVSLRDGTAFYRTYAKKGSSDPSQVTYQASLAEVTRSCTISEDQTQLTVNVVAAGRLVAGPQGKAGDITLPIRVAVVDRVTRDVIYSVLTPQVVTLTPSNLSTQFVFTNPNVVIPAGAGGEADVFVGFDAGPNR
jgi:hypothetical protein